MFSKSCNYGIRAVLYLAANCSTDKKIGVITLAEAIGVPTHFLAKILQDLSRKKLITSTKGPNGGFCLSDENRKQNVLSIVESIDGLSYFDECALGLETCGNEYPCPVHHLISPFRDNLYNELKNNTIDDFAKKLKEGKSHLKSF